MNTRKGCGISSAAGRAHGSREGSPSSNPSPKLNANRDLEIMGTVRSTWEDDVEDEGVEDE